MVVEGDATDFLHYFVSITLAGFTGVADVFELCCLYGSVCCAGGVCILLDVGMIRCLAW